METDGTAELGQYTLNAVVDQFGNEFGPVSTIVEVQEFNIEFDGEPFEFRREEPGEIVLPVQLGEFSTAGDWNLTACDLLNTAGEVVTVMPAGVSVDVDPTNDQACLFEADLDADIRDYGVRATGEQGDATATTETTVTVLREPFVIAMENVTDAFVPVSGTETFQHEVTVPLGGPIANWTCSVDEAGLTADTFGPGPDGVGCEVTIPFDFTGDSYTVTVNAVEQGTGHEATVTATGTVAAPFTAELDPDFLNIERNDSGDYFLSISFPAGSGGGTVTDPVCDASGLPAGITLDLIDDNGDLGCKATVEEFFAPEDRIETQFTFDFTFDLEDQGTQTLTGTVEVDPVPGGDFAPGLQTDVGGLSEDDRREVTRDITVNWRIIEGTLGFGIDEAASTANVDVDPELDGVEAVVVFDTDEQEYVLQVTIDENPGSGTYEVTVTLVEAGGTGEEVEVTVFLRVLDNMVVDGE